MKHIIRITYIITFLFSSLLSDAQQKTMLGVGSKAPDLVAFRWIRGETINEWKNDHFYLIEFGATWCKPCAAAIPELAGLQTKYKDKLTVSSMFVMEGNTNPSNLIDPPYINKVENYVKKKTDKINYSIAVDDPSGKLVKTWLITANLVGIPHMFLIDKKGTIRWIGNSVAQAEIELNKLDSNTGVKDLVSMAFSNERLPKKYDRTRLLLIDDNGGGQSDFLFRSVLTKYDGKIFGSSASHVYNYFVFKPDSLYDVYEDRLEIIGAPLKQLYFMAYSDTLSVQPYPRRNGIYSDTLKRSYVRTIYGKYWHEPVIEVKDRSAFEYTMDNTRNRFNYSLKVPKGYGSAFVLQEAFKRDLQTYFGYHVAVETRSMPYWRIAAPDKKLALSKLKSKNQSLNYKVVSDESPFVLTNAIMRDVVTLLAMNFGYGSLDYGKLPLNEQGAFIDETGIVENIDFTFDDRLTFAEMQAELEKYGLEITKGYKKMKVVVIRD